MPGPANSSLLLPAGVKQVLVELGPMDPEALAEVLAERGFDLGDDPEEILDEVLESDDGLLMPLIDDRWSYLPGLLEGRVFTHRVTAVELEHDVLAVAPDLEPVLMISDDPAYDRLTDGTPLPLIFCLGSGDPPEQRPVPAEAVDDSGSLLLAPGTLRERGVTSGDLVGLRFTEAGIELVRADAASPEATAGLRQRTVTLLQVQPERPQAIETIVYTLLADEPSAFVDPLPPLQDLLAAWDLPTYGDLVGVPGFSFARWQTEGRLAQLRLRYQLSGDEPLAVAALSRMHESVVDLMNAYTASQESDSTFELDQVFANASSGAASLTDPKDEGERRTVKATLPFLAEPAVAKAVLRETGARSGQDAVALGLLAETLEPQADPAARPGLRWLRAKAHEELGETAAAEEALRDSERLDRAWPPTVVDLARYAGDRGDAAIGLALLQRLPDDRADDIVPLLRDVLEQHRPAPARMLPRNQPCWCGSGRKFKQCHLRQADRLPLSERVGWLYQKAMLHVLSTTWVNLANELGRLRTAYAETEQLASELVSDGLVLDATLFEGGALEEFVDTRGTLLPNDELLLAQQWLLTERSVFEVTAVKPGVSVTLRDLRTGDVAEVPERTASREVRPGYLICTHLLSTGDGVEMWGGVEPVGLHSRDALIELLDSEPDPEDVVEFLTRRFAPPTLVNTEGDPLVLGEIVLRSADPTALAAALEGTYRREDANPDEPAASEWVETRMIDGMSRLTASFRLEGAELTLTANSEARLDAALATVRALQPSVELVADERTPMGDARTAARMAETLPASVREASAALNDQPEVRAALAEHIRTYEEQWLDLSVPALAGRTPREAADDPTRRDDLVRLLATFPDTDDPTAMSPARLRAALGLAAE